jgi:hypothetical protein
MIRRALAATALALALPGCVSTPEGIPQRAAAQTPRFDALRFFAGPSEGTGELSKLFSDRVAVRVESEGRLRPDGSLTLVQRIEEGDKPARTREWRITEVSRDARTIRYEGTLTDASGPVEGSSEGNRLTLRYPIEGGFRVEQVLTLSPDGQRASNRLEVSLAGVTVAVLAEEIVRGAKGQFSRQSVSVRLFRRRTSQAFARA